MSIVPLPPAPIPALPAPPIVEIAALAPEALAERLAALGHDLDRAYAANTKRLWRASWRVWRAFCAAAEPPWPVFPASVESLRAFLLARQAAGKRLATLEGNLATLAMAHRLGNHPWPLQTIEGALMWRGIRREYTERQHQKDGLTIEHLERILLTLNPAVPRDARDAALISVAYETQLRRSTMVALNVEHVRFDPDGTSTVFIEKSKEDQAGKGRLKELSADTTRLLRHWLTLAGITDGALFRSTPHSAKPDRFQRRLTDRDLARAYKRCAAAIGLSADIGGHSTRIGAAQDMLEEGFSGAEIMQQVGWRSERQLARYTERIQAKRAAMPRLLKRRRARASATQAEPAKKNPD